MFARSEALQCSITAADEFPIGGLGIEQSDRLRLGSLIRIPVWPRSVLC